MKLTNRKFTLLACSLIFSIAFSCILTSSAEEVETPDKMSIFVNDLSEKGAKHLAYFNKAFEIKDYEQAAKSFHLLLLEGNNKVTKTKEGNFVPLFPILEKKYLELGEEGIRAFRDRFDPEANALKNAYESGNTAAAIELTNHFPFSTYAPAAYCYLAAVYADTGKFQLCSRALEKVFSIYPEFIDTNLKVITLYTAVLRRISAYQGMLALQQQIADRGWPAPKFSGKSFSEMLEEVKSKTVSRVAERTSPGGVPSSPERLACSVKKSGLSWVAPIKDNSLTSPLEEDQKPSRAAIKTAANTTTIPIISQGKIYATDGVQVYAKELETGSSVKISGTRSMSNSNRYYLDNTQPKVLTLALENGSPCYSRPGQRWATSEIFYTDTEGKSRIFNLESVGEFMVEQDAKNRQRTRFYLASVPIPYMNQLILLGCYNNSLPDMYAVSIDISTRELLWGTFLFSACTGINSNSYSLGTIPCFHNGKVYFTVMGATACLSTETGKLLWIKPYVTKKTQYSSVIQSPVVFAEDHLLLTFPSDSSDITAIDLDNGHDLWKVSLSGLHLGNSSGKVYFSSNNTIHEIEISSGKLVKSEELPLKILGTGAVTDKYLYIPSLHTLSVFDRENYNLISEAHTPESHEFLGSIHPYGDKVFSVTADTIYCFVDTLKDSTEFTKMIADNPENPIPYYRIAILKEKACNYSEANNLLKSARELTAEGTMYKGSNLKRLINDLDGKIYRKLAEREFDYFKQKNLALKGFELATDKIEKAKLLQIVLLANMFMKNYEDAILTIQKLQDIKLPGNPCVSTKVRKALEDRHRMHSELLDSHVDTGLTNAVRNLASKEPNLWYYEDKVEELEDKVLAGDVNAAKEVFGKLYYTQNALNLAAKMAWMVLDGRATDEVTKTIALAYSAFPIAELPEMTLVKAQSVKEEQPSLASRIASDINTYYGFHQMKCPEAKKTIGFYASGIIGDIVIKEPESTPDLSDGAVEVNRFSFGKESRVYSKQIALGSAGIVYPNKNGKLTCVNAITGETVWATLPPRYSSIGVILSDSIALEGSEVMQVNEKSPAEDSGLKSGDIIIECNGNKTPDHCKFLTEISYSEPEAVLRLSIIRDGAQDFYRCVP